MSDLGFFAKIGSCKTEQNICKKFSSKLVLGKLISLRQTLMQKSWLNSWNNITEKLGKTNPR